MKLSTRLYVVTAAALITLVLMVGFMVAFVNPIVVNYSAAKIDAMTIKSVNRAVSQVVGTNTYRDLVDIRYDAQGKITSLTSDMIQINTLASSIALTAQGELDILATDGLDVPIGTFTGLPILTGKGRNINIGVIPIGSISTSFTSEFTSAGINQTRHRIVLTVHSTVHLVLPLHNRAVHAEIQVMLCESIIIGEVPEFFFHR
jgi:sporulation protein YunB